MKTVKGLVVPARDVFSCSVYKSVFKYLNFFVHSSYKYDVIYGVV